MIVCRIKLKTRNGARNIYDPYLNTFTVFLSGYQKNNTIFFIELSPIERRGFAAPFLKRNVLQTVSFCAYCFWGLISAFLSQSDSLRGTTQLKTISTSLSNYIGTQALLDHDRDHAKGPAPAPVHSGRRSTAQYVE